MVGPFDGRNAPEIARSLYAQRRARDAAFGVELFGEPAWDLLLDLFIAHAQDRPVSLISMCVAASVPLSSGQYWLARLEREGLVELLHADCGMGLTLVALSETASDRMTRFLEER